jgi:hypothetical protein
VVLQFAEVLPSQAKQCRAIEPRAATDVVVGVGVHRLAVRVVPCLLCLVTALYVHESGIPVALLARDPIAAFQNQDPFALARGGERACLRRHHCR